MDGNHEERISVTMVAAAFRATPMSDDALRALAELTEVEASVLTILTAHRIATGGLSGAVAGVLRTAGRRRIVRRALPTADDATRRAFASVRGKIDATYGKTRPVDPLASLCAALYSDGLTPAQIVDVLDATGLERTGTDAGAARKRVDERIGRHAARLSTAQASRAETPGLTFRATPVRRWPNRGA